MHSAFAGEVRFVVENNGVKKLDTGFNKNIILNQGLHFFGGGKGYNMMNYCLVGSGNSAPTVTQNQLDSCVTGVQSEAFGASHSYTPDASNTYKCSLTQRYVFTTLAGQNISEVGLASQYSSPSSNYLCTRALVKDASGNPTVLSLITGDTLTIYYKLWAVHSTLDTDQVINMSDGFGGSENYNVKSRLAGVGDANYSSLLSSNFNTGNNGCQFYTGNLVAITGYLDGNIGVASSVSIDAYANDFSRTIRMKANTSTSNGSIRSVFLGQNHGNAFGFHQVRFGRVSDDAPIYKDNTKELTIPVKFTWGRYEGVL